jgi:tRNA (guanine37-N1)-methyltransferase
VLISGDHKAILRWRRKQALRKTRMMRPDLLANAKLTDLDKEILSEIEEE